VKAKHVAAGLWAVAAGWIAYQCIAAAFRTNPDATSWAIFAGAFVALGILGSVIILSYFDA
jgi:hypothetical protein